MGSEFYMFYRMRNNMTFSVKECKNRSGAYSVKVIIGNCEECYFTKCIILGLNADSPDRAINRAMQKLLDIETYCFEDATREDLINWDKL